MEAVEEALARHGTPGIFNRLHDSQVWDALLHGEETSVWADKGYVSAEREAAFAGPGKAWGVLRYKRFPGSFA